MVTIVILLTTAFKDENFVYDYVATNVRHRWRLRVPKTMSYGLRFLKENLHNVEILEYPTWEEYVSALRNGWDAVGISFYLYEVPKAIKMAICAKNMGHQVWAGNYGALTPGIEKYFDRSFIGYAESALADLLGQKIDRLKHPPLIRKVSLPKLDLGIKGGVLFTTRGCTVGCRFCQTPSFCPSVSKIPIESIEEVLRYYKQNGVKFIGIADENFGLLKGHADEVVALLNNYGFYWGCMARADFVLNMLDDWCRGKFLGAAIGVENFSQEVLDKINKKLSAETVMEFVKEMKKRGLGVIGYYMIGFEDETYESIKRDLKKLSAIGLDAAQICILTPLPKTPLWEDIEEKYGIFEKDYSKFDTKHLVWNHPHISPEEMRSLLHYGFRVVNSKLAATKAIVNFFRLLYRLKKESKI